MNETIKIMYISFLGKAKSKFHNQIFYFDRIINKPLKKKLYWEYQNFLKKYRKDLTHL